MTDTANVPTPADTIEFPLHSHVEFLGKFYKVIAVMLSDRGVQYQLLDEINRRAQWAHAVNVKIPDQFERGPSVA